MDVTWKAGEIMRLEIGKKIVIQGYKHDGSLHRIWQESIVLEDNDEWIVVANRRTKVIESTGRFWYTKEPSVVYFYKHHWYNVIGIIKPTGISYYCNLSSPIAVDEEALKYIDYDLDVKVSPSHLSTLLDQNEYKKHQDLMKYPESVKSILEKELVDLQKHIDRKDIPFRHEVIEERYQMLLSMVGKKG